MLHRLGAGGSGRERLACAGDDAIAIAQLNFQREARGLRFEMGNEAGDVDARPVAEHVLRLREDVFQMRCRHGAQPHVAIDAAKREVINRAAEGRNVGALGGIELDHQDVLAVPIEVGRELERKRRVAALVFAEALAVEPHGARRHGAVEVHEDVLAAGLRRNAEVAAVGGDELRAFLVEAVPREPLVGVRDDDALEFGIVEGARARVLHALRREAPVAIHAQHEAAGPLRLRGDEIGQRQRGERRGARFHEVAAIHARS